MTDIERANAGPPPPGPGEGFAWVDPAGRLIWWTAGFARHWPTEGAPALRAGDPTIWSEEFLALVRTLCEGSDTADPRSLPFARLLRGRPELPDAPAVELIRGVRDGAPGPGLLLRVPSDSREEAAALREELFYAAYRTSSNPMEITDVRGILLDVNPAFERVYGYSPAECRGRKPSLVRSRHTALGLYEAMWAALTDPTVGHWAGEIVNRDRWGGEHPVLLSIAAIRDRHGEIRYYLGVTEDLTERRAWEAGAIRADRLASLGQLSAGVAHELNTPLANISLLAESLRRRVDRPEVADRVESIQQQVEEAGRIVRGLLDFARVSPTSLRRVDLATAVREAVALVQGMRSPDVEIRVRLPDEPMEVLADRGQLVQVLTNLLHNAYDAMGDSGRIEIEGRVDDSRAEVTVADSGPGIPERDLPRIFEPFFTIKQEGKGTGLGLAVSFRIMAAHHGAIVASNRPAGGAAFRITLPGGRGRSAVAHALGSRRAGRTRVPARPRSAAPSDGMSVMIARPRPPRRKSRTARTFGPMLPSANSPRRAWPASSRSVTAPSHRCSGRPNPTATAGTSVTITSAVAPRLRAIRAAERSLSMTASIPRYRPPRSRTTGTPPPPATTGIQGVRRRAPSQERTASASSQRRGLGEATTRRHPRWAGSSRSVHPFVRRSRAASGPG